MTKTTSNHITIGALFESARLNINLDEPSQAHLAGCEMCSGRLSWMRTATDLGPLEQGYEPPQVVMDNVLRMGQPGYLKKLRNFIVATLTFDSFSSAVPVGVRRAETASRDLTYKAGDLEIAVSVGRSANRRMTVTGQVLTTAAKPIEDVAARVDLLVARDHIATSPLSPWGEFVFPDLAEAEYGLQLDLSDRLITIPKLPFSAM